MNRLWLMDRSLDTKTPIGMKLTRVQIRLRKKKKHFFRHLPFFSAAVLLSSFLCGMDGQVFVRQLSRDTYLNLSLIEINRMVNSSHFTHLNLPIKQFQWLAPQARQIPTDQLRNHVTLTYHFSKCISLSLH